MKVGDIVELSAYGKSVDYLGWLSRDAIGLVTAHSLGGWGRWKVVWYAQGAKRHLRQRPMRLDRKCLKHAKVNK